MEFRAPDLSKQETDEAIEFFTKNLENPDTSRERLEELITELGSAVGSYPDWHPILREPSKDAFTEAMYLSDVKAFKQMDHTRSFVRGFITCPYSSDAASELIENVNKISGLYAYQLDYPLYADNAFPVVVEAVEVELEADGTIRSRDALKWFLQKAADDSRDAQVAETWWNIRSLILGTPHGSRSSLFVNQHAGGHMRKILEALNESGVYGEIKEDCLDMLSKTKRNKISETLLRAAIDTWDKESNDFQFELRGETCDASVKDTWDDGFEISIRVKIGKFDLTSRGFYYPEEDRFSYTDPRGKRKLAEKFI